MFGLAVLFILVVYVALAKWAVQAVGRHTKSWIAKGATILVFALIPLGDILPGRMYHAYLCETEGGVVVHKTVEVNKSYYLENGRLDEKKLEERFDWQRDVDRNYSKVFHITRYQGSFTDRKTKEQLGRRIDFWHYGGWVHWTISGLVSPTDCRLDSYENMVNQVFHLKEDGK